MWDFPSDSEDFRVLLANNPRFQGEIRCVTCGIPLPLNGGFHKAGCVLLPQREAPRTKADRRWEAARTGGQQDLFAGVTGPGESAVPADSGGAADWECPASPAR